MNTTNRQYTDTSEGRINHLKLTSPDGITIHAPVCIERQEKRLRGSTEELRPKPLRDRGALLYALPAGNTFAVGEVLG
jgi:hypothetical protein